MLRVTDLGRRHFDPNVQTKTAYTEMPCARSHRRDRRVQRVMLISPPATLYRADLPRCTYPLGLGYLAAVLEQADYDVAILDCLVEGYYTQAEASGDADFITYGIGEEEIARRIAKFSPDVVGVSSIFSNQSDAIAAVFRAARRSAPNALLVTGGAHARYFPHHYLQSFALDAVFLGEAEAAIVDYLDFVNGAAAADDLASVLARTADGIIEADDMALIRRKHRNADGHWADIDHIPFPAWHLYNMEAYFQIGAYQSPYTLGSRVGQIYTSRGCTAKCTFCTTTNFWGGKLRRRSPANVAAELHCLIDRYGIDEFHVQDDNITNDQQHAKALFQRLAEFKLPWCTPQGTALWRMDEQLLDLMAEAGCYQVTFAIESASQRVLDELIRKPLNLARTQNLVRYARSIGLSVHGFFIIGMPPMFGFTGETKEEMWSSFEFAQGAGFSSASFFTATPIVGSVLLDECLRQGFVSQETPLYRMSYKQGLIDVPGLWEGREIASLAAHFNQAFNEGRCERVTSRSWSAQQY
ncbi:MAG: cobalamin-dependent protein [Vitreimonas sp.]